MDPTFHALDPRRSWGASLRVSAALTVGGAIYLLFRAPNLVMFQWTEAAGLGPVLNSARIASQPAGRMLSDWLSFSLPNALWTYALAIAMHAVWFDARNLRGVTGARGALVITGILPIAAEAGQALGLVAGTFDIMDMATAGLAWGLAVFETQGEAMFTKNARRWALTSAVGMGFAILAAGSGTSAPAGTAAPVTGPALEVTAVQLASDYTANEVSADLRYKDKPLIVTGSIEAISKDFMDRVILRLGSGNQFLPVSATLVTGQTAQAATLSVGAAIKVRCTGNGLLMSPQLSDCVIQ